MREALRFIAGVFVGILPRYYWSRFEDQVSPQVAAGAIVTILAGAAIGIPGFFAHAEDVSVRNNRALLAAAAKQDPATTPQHLQVSTTTLAAASGLSWLTFILLTPAGWISTYLVASGSLRAIGAASDSPLGDPLLTAIDKGLRTSRVRRRARRAAVELATRQGPDVADRVRTGAEAGVPGAALVVVSSRRKEGWTTGTVVLTPTGAYRIVCVEDRMIAGLLRHLYGLVAHDDLEVFRRVVPYDLPAGRPT
ncbi:MAG: hypothetical protein WEB50_16080 [Vicinamibacterales bacterium]